MDQRRIGAFLRELRKEKHLTQEQLAERLNVSGRTVSRWETGANMPDIAILVEIAEFYDVSIPEIIKGERKSENMNQETKETAIAMAEYSKTEVKSGKKKVSGILLTVFGAFIIVTALAIFPSESSWGSVYSILGSIILLAGIYILIKPVIEKKGLRMLAIAGCIVLLFASFTISDYVGVAYLNQVPRFRISTSYNSSMPNQLVYKTLFFTVIQKNPGTANSIVYIIK